MNFASIPSLIAAQDNGPITVHRAPGATKNAKGEWVPAASVPIVISPAVVHVSGARTIDRLPEALREREVLRATTLERLHDGSLGELPDQIEWQGVRYEVQSVADHAVLAGCYTTLATRLEPR